MAMGLDIGKGLSCRMLNWIVWVRGSERGSWLRFSRCGEAGSRAVHCTVQIVRHSSHSPTNTWQQSAVLLVRARIQWLFIPICRVAVKPRSIPKAIRGLRIDGRITL